MVNRTHGDPLYTELRKEYPRTWRIWYRMNKRCKINQNGDYSDVSVCDDWNIDNGSPEAFCQFLDDMGPCEDYREIDRINPFGNYEPGNCRWVEPQINRQNTRARAQGLFKGLDTAKRNGIVPATYYGRLRAGWSQKDAQTLPASAVNYDRRTDRT